MDWSKAKNLIIGMLIAVNLFLLVICWIAERNRLSIRDAVVSQTVTYLSDHGTQIDPSLLTGQALNRSILLIERDEDAEKQLAQSLIGGKEVSRTGGIVRFSTDDGSASALWRNGGLFETGLTIQGAYDYEGNVETHPAIQSLQAVGISSSVLREDRVDDLRQVTIEQQMNELPVFNATLTVTCGSNDAVYIAGRWCVGTAQTVSEADEMELAGLLIRFIDRMGAGNMDLSRITDIRPGYMVQSLATSGVKLIPVWAIETPGAVSYISAVDGTIVVSE